MRNAFKLSLAVLSAPIVLVTLILFSFVIVDLFEFRAKYENSVTLLVWVEFASSISLIAAYGIMITRKLTPLLPGTSFIV